MRLNLTLSLTLSSFVICASANMQSAEEKLSYSLGARLAKQIQSLDEIDQQALSQGIFDVLNKHPLQLPEDEIEQHIKQAKTLYKEKQNSNTSQKAAENLQKSEAFLIENSLKPGVISLKSGLQYRIIKEGIGSKALSTDEVTVAYEGRLLNGDVFDSTYQQGKPTTVKLNHIISGWSEGLQEMPAGSVWELYIPSYLAYGDIGIPGKIAPNEMLIFKIELKEINK